MQKLANQKASSRSFCVCKELGTTSVGNQNFWSKLLSYQILSRSACRLPQIPFYRGFFENWEGPGTSFQATFFIKIFDKEFSFVSLHKLAKFHYQTVFTFKLFSKEFLMFHAWVFDDLMTFEYLESQNLIISRMKRAFEVKEKIFFLVSQLLSFKLAKQTSKNVAATPFKYFCTSFAQLISFSKLVLN